MAEPTVLLAPGRFSTMMVWPSRCASLSMTMRVVVSVAPPGVYGTMTLIGLFGQASAASAGPARVAPASAAEADSSAASAARRDRAARGKVLGMDVSPPVGHEPGRWPAVGAPASAGLCC